MESELRASPTVISYAHGAHDDDVLALANRLIEEGVPCELDLFDPRPPGGLSRWMNQKMGTTDVVLVVCSKPYYDRYHLHEAPGVGTGATFEGGMLSRRVLDAQGSEHGVIPIVFDRADLPFRPEFLRDEAYFVLPERFDDLYRVLTHQPAHVRPPLGAIRRMPTVSVAATRSEPVAPSAAEAVAIGSRKPLALFQVHDGSYVFGRYLEHSRSGGVIGFTLAIEDDDDAAAFPRLQAQRGPVAMSWRFDVAVGKPQSYREHEREGRRVVDVTFAEDRRPGSSYASEANVNGITADQIALRRARRILLDERPKDDSELGSFSTDRMNGQMLEMYVSGSIGGGVTVKGSPIPVFLKDASDRRASLDAARQMCVLALHMSNCVERITRLDMTLVGTGVAVNFRGVRARAAQNVEPTELSVDGVCPLP